MRRSSTLVALALAACSSDPTELGDGEAGGSASDSVAASEASTSSIETDTGLDAETGTETETASEGESASESGTETGIEPGCGDGVVDPDEQCDGDDLDGFDCTDLGYLAGELACNPRNCTFDASGCNSDAGEPNSCHDHVLEDDEVCDHTNFGALSCEALGFVGGSLICNWWCSEALTPACLESFESDACVDDLGCGPGFPHCVGGHCFDGSLGDLCDEGTDCGEGMQCIRGQCWDGGYGQPCELTDDCAGNLLCNSLIEVCTYGGWWEPCGTSQDCSGILICLDGICNGV